MNKENKLVGTMLGRRGVRIHLKYNFYFESWFPISNVPNNRDYYARPSTRAVWECGRVGQALIFIAIFLTLFLLNISSDN